MKETEFDENVKNAITAEKRKEQKEYLRSLEASLSESKESPKRFNWRIAASITLIVGLASTFFLWNSSPSNDELYNTYFQPYANVIEPVVRDQVNPTKRAQVFADYEQGKYQKALEGLYTLTLQDSISFSTISFYQANVYLELKEFDKAKNLFQTVVDQNKEWKEESLWYLGLTSLKLNDVIDAKSYLQRLQQSNKSAFKKEEVEIILNSLD